MFTYILFVAGFFLLIFGADWLVEGATSIARRFKISDLVIGLTIVSFGTSAPELVVNVIASYEGKATLAIANILGSNVANILLILGIAALIRPLSVKSNTIWKEIPLSLLAAVILAVVANDVFIDGNGPSEISRSDGVILISFFIIFMYYTFGLTGQGTAEFEDLEEHGSEPAIWKSIVLTGAGLIALPVGGDWIVDGAVLIAHDLGIAESVIGVVIVGVGTSLPEVAASAVAAYKGKTDIAIGNAVGSNIFNIFWVLGVSAMIRPLPYDIVMNPDMIMTVVASLILFFFVFLGRPYKLGRLEGTAFLTIYLAYIIFLLVLRPYFLG